MKPKRSEINKRRLVLAMIAVACFVVVFFAAVTEIMVIYDSSAKPFLLATMPVRPLRMIVINQTSPDKYTYVDTLYVLAADGSIYGCVLHYSYQHTPDSCAPAQLPATLSADDYDNPIDPVNFMGSPSVIDFMAYRAMNPEGYNDEQLNMTADGSIWQRETGENAYGILFVIIPLSGLTSLIITILTVWIINRLLRRRLQRSPPSIDIDESLTIR